jgi:hypothetical protein
MALKRLTRKASKSVSSAGSTDHRLFIPSEVT